MKTKIDFEGHVYSKGTFVTSMNTIPNLQLNEWAKNRLPEYLWIALLIDGDRTEGLEKAYQIIKYIVDNIDGSFGLPALSKIICLSEDKQLLLYQFIDSIGLKERLYPLTLFLTQSRFPCFANYFVNERTMKERFNVIRETIKKCYSHNSDFSTDVRFIVVWSMLLSKRLHLSDKTSLDAFTKYPYVSHGDEIMKAYCPEIRSMEGVTCQIEDLDKMFMSQYFWKEFGAMSDCELFKMEYKNDFDSARDDLTKIESVIRYYDDLLSIKYLSDDKALVLFGLMSYAYTRYKEIIDHNLFKTPSGRSALRAMIESYFLIKYMISEESNNQNVYKDFREYGAGQYKLTTESMKKFEYDYDSTHLNNAVIEALSNDEKDPLYTNMETKYFKNFSVRKAAESFDEMPLYIIYNHDSSFEHALWCSVVESSMLHCNNPSHRYHKTLSVEGSQDLQSVYHDSLMMMKKIIEVVSSEYELPEKIKP